MGTITTNEGSIKIYIGGNLARTVTKGKFDCDLEMRKDYLTIISHSDRRIWEFGVGTTLDGVAYDDLEELAEVLSSFNRGGGSGEGLQRATIQEMQTGTDNEKYTTAYLVAAFVQWFSEDLIKIDEDQTEPLTSAQVNEAFPDARLRTIVYFPNVGTGLKYTKISAEQWESQPYTLA